MTDSEMRAKIATLGGIEHKIRNLLGDQDYALYENALYLTKELVIEQFRREMGFGEKLK